MKVVIVGVGKLGSKLAELMISENMDVTLIDLDAKVLEGVNEHLDVLTLVGNAIEIKFLKELDIGTYNLLIASTNTDESNILICSLAKKLGCEKTIARIRNQEYMMQLDFIQAELGIDFVINPDLMTAREIEKYLFKRHSFDSSGFAEGKVRMINFNIEHMQEFIGKKLMMLKDFNGLLITAISRNGDIIIPDGNTQLLDQDVVHIIGKASKINDFLNMYDKKIRKKEIDRVMILGGSNLGFYLAKNLSTVNTSVTLIEKDKERCIELSELLNDVLIIHGDGTDINVLEEERISTMDVFIGATGFDEQNLLMGLMAKQSGVFKTISKVSRENYTKVIDRLGIDIAINPTYITASNILKYIKGGKVVSISLLIGGDGEVTEIIIDRKLPILGKTLQELKLPKGIIIGAMVRNSDVIIPSGETTIEMNDRIVVFSLKENLPALKIFFRKDNMVNKGGILNEFWHHKKNPR